MHHLRPLNICVYTMTRRDTKQDHLSDPEVLLGYIIERKTCEGAMIGYRFSV